MKKAFIAIILIISIVSSVVFADETIRFTDLENHWSAGYVYAMANAGLVNGYEDGSFRPEQTVTRGEFAKFLTTVYNLNGTSKYEFEDLNGHWAKTYVDAASQYLTGYKMNGKYYFMPDQPAVREDITVALVKASDKTGSFNASNVDLSLLDKFSDANSISENLKPYVAYAVEEGLING